MPRCSSSTSARRRAAGHVEPDRLTRTGQSAECGRDSPSASPTTCDVAAVPRNWQPPPGDAHARQPSSAACSSVISPWAYRAPMRLHLAVSSSPLRPASRSRRRGRATDGRSRCAGQGHHHRRQALVARRHAEHAAPGVGSDRISRRSTIAASLRYGRLSNMPAVPCVRPSHGSVTAPANGTHPSRCSSSRGRLHQQADLPVAGVIAERDGRAVGGPQPAVRDEDRGTPFGRAVSERVPCRRSASSRTNRRSTSTPAFRPRVATIPQARRSWW